VKKKKKKILPHPPLRKEEADSAKRNPPLSPFYKGGGKGDFLF
jgi:hypothetical protein